MSITHELSSILNLHRQIERTTVYIHHLISFSVSYFIILRLNIHAIRLKFSSRNLRTNHTVMVLYDSTKFHVKEGSSIRKYFIRRNVVYLSAVIFIGFVPDSCSHVFSYSCITKNLSSMSTSGSIRYQPDEHASLIELPSEQFIVGNHIKPSEQQLMSVVA